WHVKADAGGTGSGLSWQDAFGTLQEALAQTTGTEIWLAAGSYSPGSQRTAAFVPQNGSFQPVTLAGGFAGWETSRRQRSDKTPPSILDGQGVNYHVVVGANGAVLERLHIVNGRADGSASLGQGGAIRLDGVSLYVVDCVLRDNYAVYGGAVYAEQTSSTWRNCSFIDNYAEQAGGGCYFVQTGGLLSGCTFSGNASGDQGGGLYLTGSTVAVSGCRFHQNESKYGAGLAAGSTASAAENTVFYGNIATMDGGGCFHGPGGDLAYVNCTWALNQADRGGAMHQLDASPTIHNSILWFDCAGPAQANPEISNEGDASPLFGFCNLQGCGGSLLGFWNETLGRDGGYNIDTAPVFEDLYNPVGADGVWATRDDGLHVCCYKRAGSLFVPQARRGCLDSANGHIAPPRDITGRIRNDVAYISNGGQGPLDYADLGAYESPTVWYVDSQAGGSSCGRCWQDAFISLDAALAAAGTFAGAFDPAGRDPNSYYPEEIWIAEGTYFPLAFGWQQQASFQLKTGLALYGGFAGQETNLNQRDWLEHETILAGTGSDPVLIGGDHAHLDGLTVTGGYNDSGGGLLASQIEMTLRHCIFRSNSAYPRGGAICQEGGILRGEDCLFEFNFGSIGGAINSCGGTLELYNCLFQNNQANGFTAGFGTGGAVHFKGTLLRLENCCFDENQAGRSGGALWAAGRCGRILDCNFQSNQVNGVTYFGDGRGGACTNSNLRDGVYARCVFAGNSIMYGSVKAGLGGGLYNEQSRIDLVNCVLYHNQASEGGGIYNNQCEHVAILHTTFDSNIASDYAGAVVNYQTDPRITNCILWNDWVGGLVKEVYDKYSSSNPADSLVVSCDLGEGEGDRDCICVDPQYLAPSNPWGPDLIAGTADDGLQLSSPSGCVDQGQDLVLRDPNLAAFICVDLAGVPRRQHGGSSLTADLGAFEFGGIVAPDQTGIQTNQDTPCTITPDATDIASEPLTIEVVQAPSLGTVEVGPDGSLLYTPNPYAHGEDSFRYRASDGVNSAYATVSLTILDADDGPVAVDDVVHVQQGQYLGVDIDVLDNDDHPDEGSSMNLVAVSESTDDYTITISNNTVHLTWDQEYEGSPDRTITFTYEVEDDDEDPGKDSDTGNVTVHLHVPPEAQDDDFTLPAGAVGRLAVFANDIDDDGDGLQLDSFQYPEPGGERHGTLVYHGGGVFTYRPFDGFCGDDSFYYTLIDPAGNLSNTVDVALTVSDTVEFQDADGDGVSDTDEGQYSTDPTLADTDGDGLDDGWEIHWQRPGALAIDPLVWSDPDGDPDGDQLSNQDEQRYGLDPFDPDSDQDGCSDYVEVLEGLDPLRPDGTVGAASTIPYHTSFDWSEFTCFTSIHGQNGWQVEN
ncbi:MAG: cadherin-like domain-containing protein, partial [Sedimentisphaerales bacterium]|nr:cadherin-like domain-containing protein [Sedimentisphaerales bacterium]